MYCSPALKCVFVDFSFLVDRIKGFDKPYWGKRKLMDIAELPAFPISVFQITLREFTRLFQPFPKALFHDTTNLICYPSTVIADMCCHPIVVVNSKDR